MGLTVAISNKQTVQVSARAYSERGVDLIHRRILNELLPSFEREKQYQLVDFDVLYGTLVHDKQWLA
jgi:hypothetical protein